MTTCTKNQMKYSHDYWFTTHCPTENNNNSWIALTFSQKCTLTLLSSEICVQARQYYLSVKCKNYRKREPLSRRVFELYRICNELVEKLLKRSNFNASDTFLCTLDTLWYAFDFSLWFHCLLHNVDCICEVMWMWIIGDKVQGVAIFFS